MRSIFLSLFSGLFLLMVGCATPETVQRRSSLSAYLGGTPSPPVNSPVGPARLQLPLRMGIAFVPPEAGQRTGSLNATAPANLLEASREQELHKKVSDLFGQKPWALSFKIIPAQYLTRGGGFQDLEQVAQSFGVEVMALVSVDQMQFSSPRWYSWTYWTLVGAYMVKGDKNDTTTLVDAAVYHVPTHTFLFRAGGVGTVKGGSTWSGREDAFRQQSRESLSLAMADLSKSLDVGVADFKQELLKGSRKDVVLLDREGNLFGSTAYDPARK